MVRRRSLFKIVARAVGLAALALICVFVGLIALYAYATPVSTLMLARKIEDKPYERFPVRLGDVAPTVIASVIVSEDVTFCQNDGVDWGALHEVMNSSGKDERRRGASTITMQTAKNLFLWPGRSVLRKSVEIPIALVLGKVWSKRRTLEIYLNIAEWGDGTFGVGSRRASLLPQACKRARCARGGAARDLAAESDRARSGASEAVPTATGRRLEAKASRAPEAGELRRAVGQDWRTRVPVTRRDGLKRVRSAVIASGVRLPDFLEISDRSGRRRRRNHRPARGRRSANRLRREVPTPRRSAVPKARPANSQTGLKDIPAPPTPSFPRARRQRRSR